jgi:hypothetical protein
MESAVRDESDSDDENKGMNPELIRRHEKILDKIDRGQRLTQEDLELIRDANEIHLSDEDNVAGHHKEAVALNAWPEQRIEPSKDDALKILQLQEEATPDDVVKEHAYDENGKCLKCGSKVAFADVTDTLVFVGDEIVKRYDGDISNGNCVRCNYLEQCADYEEYDKAGS